MKKTIDTEALLAYIDKQIEDHDRWAERAMDAKEAIVTGEPSARPCRPSYRDHLTEAQLDARIKRHYAMIDALSKVREYVIYYA